MAADPRLQPRRKVVAKKTALSRGGGRDALSGWSLSGTWAMLGCMTAFACYDIKNNKTIGWDVVVNRPKVAAYRAPSAPMAAFAVEAPLICWLRLGMSAIDVPEKRRS